MRFMGRRISLRVSGVVIAALASLPTAALAQGFAGSQAVAAPSKSLPRITTASSPAGARRIDRYTTANSDTYALPNGHMLTRVFEYPVNRRDSSGKWQTLTASQSAAAAKAPVKRSAIVAAERNPLGQENESACTLTSTAPTSSACNELTFKVGYETASSTADHGLIQFVLPELHEELTVLDAQLELYALKTSTTSSAPMGAYRVTTPWSVSATWNTTNGSTPWRTPGGDYSNPPEAESDAAINSSVGSKKGWVYWYPTKMVQEWYNGVNAPSGQGQPDLGFLLKDVSEGPTNNVVSFAGREERTHNPGLTLEWAQRGVGSATNYTQLPIQQGSPLTMKVNPASGNLMIHSDDLRVPSKGLEFDSARTWNSLANEAFGYGYGWVDSNAVYVHVTPTGSVAYTDSSGNTFPFVKERANFITPPGIEATMCTVGSATPCPVTLPKGVTYQLIYTSTQERIDFGSKHEYNYPVEVLDAAGETEVPHYTTGLEEPTSWTDTEGTKIVYTESETLGYTKITNEANSHSVSYTEKVTEDGLSHLLKYVNENKEQTSYTIGTGLEGNLIREITEPNGTVIKLYYDSQYRITKIIKTTNAEHTTGPTTTFTYYGYGKAPAPCTATQKATVVAEAEGGEEPTLTYCSNVLDEVEQVGGYPQTGQSGGYLLQEEDLGESETEVASVNLASGNLFDKTEDVPPEAVDANLRLDRFYNSQARPVGVTLSPRWSWGTGPSVYLRDEGATVVLHGPSGYTVVLKRASSSSYTAQEGFEGSLTKNADGSYTLTNQDGPTYQFNPAGELTSETTEEGNIFAVGDTTISGKSVLHSLSPASGKSLEVAYDSTPHVTTTTDPAGRVRHYEYNASKQLATYTAPSGAKTQYGYDSNGYLNRITTAEGTVESITTVGGKVSEISVTPKGGTAHGDRFTYEAPMGPTCNPATDAGETIVTPTPEGEAESVCYNSRGEFTGPNIVTEESSEETAGTGTPVEEPNETCSEITEFSPEECVEEEIPPRAVEEEGEEGTPHSASTLDRRASRYAAKAPVRPTTVEYGVSDNNNLTSGFNYFANKPFQELNVVNVRRIVPWNLVSEAARPGESTEQVEARAELKDVEKWVEEVKKLGGGHGQPLISFDHCKSGQSWYDAEASKKLEEKEKKPETVLQSCLVPPSHEDYRQAVKAFVHHPVVEGVKRFTAWNEPNNLAPVPGNPTEHVEPTWNQGELAGKYWRALYTLCKPTASNCEVAAGDFIDGSMQNAYSPYYYNKKGEKVASKTHQYFVNYYKGMGRPAHVARWAWHAYSEGKAIASNRGLRSQPKQWWQSFRNFVTEVHAVTHSSSTNFWMTEQGLIFSYKKEELKEGKRVVEEEEPLGVQYRNHMPALANADMNAYVNKGKYQLTRKGNNEVTAFYYYETRGSRNAIGAQDSGLLEIAPQPGLPTPYGLPESSPRTIYNIYKGKTPTGP